MICQKFHCIALKTVEFEARLWEIPAVHTVTTDKSKRVRLPEAKPGQVFDYAFNADGVFILTLAQ